MQVLVDTHAHYYPHYDLERFLAAAFRNLSSLESAQNSKQPMVKMLCLCERAGQTHFESTFSQESAYKETSFTLESVVDDAVAIVRNEKSQTVVIVAGRQIVSAERIELLALAHPSAVADGAPLESALAHVLSNGGIPVLCWSPGKWIGARGKEVSRLLNVLPSREVLLGDIALRSWPVPEPLQFSTARTRGFNVVAGSDPLPLEREEQEIARYVTRFEYPAQNELNLFGIRSMLRSEPYIVGSRNTVYKSVVRFLASNFAAKRPL